MGALAVTKKKSEKEAVNLLHYSIVVRQKLSLLTVNLMNTLFFVLSHSLLRDFKYFVQKLQQSAKNRVKS